MQMFEMWVWRTKKSLYKLNFVFFRNFLADEDEFRTCSKAMNCKNYCVERGYPVYNCFNGKCKCFLGKFIEDFSSGKQENQSILRFFAHFHQLMKKNSSKNVQQTWTVRIIATNVVSKIGIVSMGSANVCAVRTMKILLQKKTSYKIKQKYQSSFQIN